MSLTDMAERMEHNEFYKEGMDAYANGVLYEQNPYLGSSNEVARHQWANGWCDAEETECAEEVWY